MEFRDATDRLTECVSLADLASETGVSDATIRRARLDPDSPARRTPPPGWQAAAARLARRQERHFRSLAEALENSLRP